MADRPLLILLLAAGKGVRMHSNVPKVLHAIGGRSLLGHALAAAQTAGANRLALVVAPGSEAVRTEALRLAPHIEIFEQSVQAGTAHAVLAARHALDTHSGDVLVTFADTPLLQPATLLRLVAALDCGAHVGVLAFEPDDPTGYGRLLTKGSGRVTAVREHKDATEEELSIKLCAAGAMAFRLPAVSGLLDRIGNANASGEYYLTDAVTLAASEGLTVTAVSCGLDEAVGVNSREQLAGAEALFQARARRAAMEAGATLIAPETVWFSFDTEIGRDVVVEPNVFFGPGVVVEDGVHILANCHITGTRVRAGARVGPFARLRPGADIGPGAHIGNFVEVKNTTVEAGAKANHLAYLGDGRVGEGANIGAGTIFCNYDGFSKHRTEVGREAFVGSNSSLVAPVKIGDGAYVGSGSVITKNVAAGALALERSEQQEHAGWAAKFRQMMQRRKPRQNADS